MDKFTILIKVGYEILVDETDYVKAIKYKWSLRNRPAGMRSYPYTRIDGKEVSFSKAVFNIEEGQSLYHKNGNCLDYHRDNLLICNKSQQGHLAGSPPNKASKFTGIFYSQKMKSWRVKIIKNNKGHYIGSFRNEEEAAIVAEYLNLDLYGSHSKRNFPELSNDEICKRYKQIRDAYGWTLEEILSKSRKGVTKKRNSENFSNYVGITFVKVTGKWSSAVSHKHKRIHIGYFDSTEDAAAAYDIKVLELFGSAFKRNFPNLTLKDLAEKYPEVFKHMHMSPKERHAIGLQGRNVSIKNKSSKYNGVSYIVDRKLWRARITYNKKCIEIGIYADEVDAARAYDHKARELYGPNAKVNFPNK